MSDNLLPNLLPNMPPIRRSNRVLKPKVYWEPRIIPPRIRHPPAFTIYTEPPEDLSTQSPEDPSMQLLEDLAMHLSEGIGMQSPKDLAMQSSGQKPSGVVISVGCHYVK